MSKCFIAMVLLILVWMALLPQPAMAAPGDVMWTRRFGGPGDDRVYAVATHTTAVYAVGVLPYEESAFIRSYTSDGRLRWSRSFTWLAAGPGGYTYVLPDDVAVDSSGVYVVGEMDQLDSSCTYLGHRDTFVRKYTHQGVLVWTRFISALGRSGCSGEQGRGIAVDGTGVYVTGTTNGNFPGYQNAGYLDIFLRKYTTDGQVVWTRQAGTNSDDLPTDIDLDPWGVLVAGETEGRWPGQTNLRRGDGLVLKYNRSGRLYWIRQFGTTEREYLSSISAEGASFYVGGSTSGTFSGQTRKGGLLDAWVRKYRGDGVLIWTRQFGTSEGEGVSGLDADVGHVYITGSTGGSFPTYPDRGTIDGQVFVTNFSSTGAQGWIRQFGTPADDFGADIALGPVPSDTQQDNRRGLYVGGALNVNPLQSGDAFLRKYEE